MRRQSLSLHYTVIPVCFQVEGNDFFKQGELFKAADCSNLRRLDVQMFQTGHGAGYFELAVLVF